MHSALTTPVANKHRSKRPAVKKQEAKYYGLTPNSFDPSRLFGTPPSPNDVKALREFTKDTEEVLFLFDETIAAYLNEFLKKAHRLRAVTLRLEKNWSDSAGQQDTELTTWFSEQIEEIQRRFAPYLRPRS